MIRNVTFNSYFPVADEYSITVLPDAQQPLLKSGGGNKKSAALFGTCAVTHRPNLAFVAAARLPGKTPPGGEEVGVLPKTRSDDDVDVQVLTTAESAGLTANTPRTGRMATLAAEQVHIRTDQNLMFSTPNIQYHGMHMLV